MKTTATGALPVPQDGMRRLSAADALRRARAMACLRDPKSTQCQGKVFVNIFFDGTGNNWDWEGPFVDGKTRSTKTQRARNSHSNVTRLWDARLDEPENGFFSFYIPGVGTPFDDIGDSGQGFWHGTLGAAAARFGSDRINWGIIQVYNAMHRYLTGADLIEKGRAKSIVNNMSSQIAQLGFEGAMRQTILKTWEQRLAAVVKAHQRRLLEVNVSVFGFSRGSAQARAFVHRLYEIAKYNNDGCDHVLASVPLRFKFLGIYDTVASVGVSAMLRVTEGKMDWADGEMMAIHPAVEKCVHFTALHEQRINFPVDLAVGSSVKEVLYPGMHSDVGGGYTPGNQGKGMPGWGVSPNLSQIPLIDMHYEAIKADVPLMTIEDIQADNELGSAFACDKKLIDTYNNWLTLHGVAGGSHKLQIRAHTRLYLRWRGLRLLKQPDRLTNQEFFQRADKEDQFDLANAQTIFGNRVAELKQQKNYVDEYDRQLKKYVEETRAANRNGNTSPRYAPPRRVVSAALQDSDILELLNETYNTEPLPQAVIDLFDNYVHDSLAGFYVKGSTELDVPVVSTNGYLRYRTVFDINTTIKPEVCAAPATQDDDIPEATTP